MEFALRFDSLLNANIKTSHGLKLQWDHLLAHILFSHIFIHSFIHWIILIIHSLFGLVIYSFAKSLVNLAIVSTTTQFFSFVIIMNQFSWILSFTFL